MPEFLTWVARQSVGLAPGTEALEVPVKIVWGTNDKVIPYERYGRPLVDKLPGAELQMLPGAGHVPMYDDPDAVARAILKVSRRTPH